MKGSAMLARSRLHQAAAAQHHAFAGGGVGGGDAQRQVQTLDVHVAKGLRQPLHHQPVVPEREVGVEAAQARPQHLRNGAPASLARDLGRPQRGGDTHSLFGVVPGRDQRAEHGAGAAAHHEVGAQAFANQHFHHAQRGDTAHTAAAQHDGEAVLRDGPGRRDAVHGWARCG